VSPWLELPLPAWGSSGTATCPHGSGSRPRLEAALEASRVPTAWAPAPGSGPPRVPGLCGLLTSKQISSGGPAIMISIGAGAPVSSKVLRDKGCSARSQGMQQATH
jgi:hypothetical protein